MILQVTPAYGNLMESLEIMRAANPLLVRLWHGNVWHDEDLLGVEDLQKVAVILVSSLYMEFSFAVGSRRP